MVSINTNLQSLIVQNNLTKSSNSLNKAIERLTTGFKINHASDNAANYSITENMSSKLSSYMVAEENTSMGLDLIQTQSATLETIQNLTTRLRALAEQAHNGTYGPQSLEAINQEAEAITQEITRIAQNAEYNGIKLFDNASSKYGLPQATHNGFVEKVVERDTSSMTKVSSLDPNVLINSGTYSISTAEELLQVREMCQNNKLLGRVEFVLANDIDLSAYSEGRGWIPIGTSEEGESGVSPNVFVGIFDGNGHVISNLSSEYGGLFERISNTEIKNLGLVNCNIDSEESNVGALVGNSLVSATITNCYVQGTVRGDSAVGMLIGGSNGDVDITNCYSSGSVYGNSTVGGLVGRTSDGGNASWFTKIINSYSTADVYGVNNNIGGFIGYLKGTSVIESSLYAGRVSGENGYVGAFVGQKADTSDIGNSYIDMALNSGKAVVGNADNAGAYDIKDVSASLQVGINGQKTSQISITYNMSLMDASGLISSGLESQASFAKIDNFINRLSSYQTQLGAIQNRLESNIESIGVNIENLTSSRSTMKDADVAEESSNYIKAQILQQASATLLATANQTPELTLRLLGALK